MDVCSRPNWQTHLLGTTEWLLITQTNEQTPITVLSRPIKPVYCQTGSAFQAGSSASPGEQLLFKSFLTEALFPRTWAESIKMKSIKKPDSLIGFPGFKES